MGRLLWMYYNRAKCLFHLFVTLFARAIRSACVKEIKKKTSQAGPVEDKTALRVVVLFLFLLFIYLFYLFIYLFIICLLLQRSCSNCPDAHAHDDLELWWSYVFLDAVPYFICLFFFL